ncbi:major facilitator superfamily domain-containing protein [Aspergillus transmontanensis]|uniref:Major facilitator superfamily domain-containing protein n=1 Tax=Aspergillus transmontanensis TaxID=1034304 RepID=A0A5N6VJ29_9EURO|nr:major facilitator superfamily domain-containing protein [Aspergillus transmontanensis]
MDDTHHSTGASQNAEEKRPTFECAKVNGPEEFPDGGLRAWLVALGAFFGLFISFGWTNCVGVFQAYYQTHQLQSKSPSTVSWIPATSMFMIFITGPVVGRLYDNFGPRYLLLIGAFLHVFGLMMTSISSQYYQFILAQAICSPIGAGMVMYPCFSCVTTWFMKKRALVMGIVASGSSLGGVVLPILVDRLMPQIGFGWTMRTCAFLMLALLIVTNLTVRPRLPSQPKTIGIMAFIRPFKDVPFLLTALASFFYSMGMFIPITFMVTYGKYRGMSVELAGYLVPIFNAASGIGRILPGYAADRLGNYNVSLCAACFSSIFVLALWLPGQDQATAIAFAALFGLSSGTYTAISPALVAQISDIREIGTRSGTMYACMSVAALTGSPIGGALISAAGGSYWKLQVFTGIMLAMGTIFYITARMHLAKGKLWIKV